MSNKITFVTATLNRSDITSDSELHEKVANLWPPSSNSDPIFFVDFHSWNEQGTDHPEFDNLIKIGKKYRETIEEVE